MDAPVRDWAAFVTPGEGEDIAHLDLAVEGITCAACMVEIERGLGALPGVTRARLNLTNHRLALEWNPQETGAATLIDSLERLGYRAHPFDPGRRNEAELAESRMLMRALAVAAFSAMNIMLLSVSVWAGNASDMSPTTRDFFHWLSALLALPAAAYSGRPFYLSAIRAVRAGRLNMDVPITIGVTLALALSVMQTIQHAAHAYYESAMMLLFFLLIGRWLDHNMRRRTRAFAENIAALRAETAILIGDDGGLSEVPVSAVGSGERVLVRPGERVSVDGVVASGSSEIDQSLVTGETGLVGIGPGAEVYAGTLNGSGQLEIRVVAAGSGTLIEEVNRLLDNAMQAKSRYMRLADRAAGLYAPLVHGAALLTFIGWWLAGIGWQPSLVIAISVLIITCPCALGLAIPAVQVVASGVLFREGVLINSGDAIERLAVADTIVFDKTGTLTLPAPEIVNADEIAAGALDAAARLALSSRHPLAAIISAAGKATAPFDNAEEIAGSGVAATFGDVDLRLGSPAFCDAEAEAETIAGRHPTASLIAYRVGENPPVVFAVEQALRTDAVAVADALRQRGLTLHILSGDRPAAVAGIAAELGIDDWQGGLKPTEKIVAIEKLRDEGRKVLMVGDGLNDAPSLAAADVSVSPVTAVSVSQAVADCVFMGSRLGPVVTALDIARRAHGIMKENLWIAAVYNVVAVPLAVAGFVTPLLAAAAMSGSSIVVTLNAWRARLGRAGLGEA
ncbi:MAG: heavy metal translocating P-type ATPase [Hyphomicrobiales bacterium]|nr:heavy metal translocating P-type ATPase [Hyphomicrobiales bacterium]